MLELASRRWQNILRVIAHGSGGHTTVPFVGRRVENTTNGFGPPLSRDFDFAAAAAAAAACFLRCILRR